MYQDVNEQREQGSAVISRLVSEQQAVRRSLDDRTRQLSDKQEDALRLKESVQLLTSQIDDLNAQFRTVDNRVTMSEKGEEIMRSLEKGALAHSALTLANLAAAFATGGSSLLIGGPGQAAFIADRLKKYNALMEQEKDLEMRRGFARGEIREKAQKARASQINERQMLVTLESTIDQDNKERLYRDVLRETQLATGLTVARIIDAHAQFSGTTIDQIFADIDIRKPELITALNALVDGTPSAQHIAMLVAAADEFKNETSPTAELRALRQFLNQTLIPHHTYFDVVASFADDVRAQGDLGTFPPLEIFNHKPISLSGRRQIDEAEMPEQMSGKIAARTAVEGEIEYGHVGALAREQKPLIDKLKVMDRVNEAEIKSYAKVFEGIENAVSVLEEKRAELEGNRRTHADRLIGAEKANADIDARIREMDARNQAKQKAATRGSIARGSLAVAAGVALAICDGGIFTGPVIAEGGKSLAGMLAIKTLKDSHHSLTYGIGQGVATKVENAALADYMDSLRAQKVNIPALKTEIEAVEKAIVETVGSKGFQDLMQSEAKRSYVAETLLQRSLIRNGYNNASDIDELARDHGLASVDAVLQHYQGTRLGLALQKHCHGIADSNDMRVLLTESDCLRGQPDGADAVLREYVEGTMKPNIGAFLSKASKMDVVRQANLTGYGTDLHFPAEIGMENSRAVRILLANEFGMSVVGRNDVRDMFDFWLHRYGDRQLYDDKIRDGEMTDHYPDKRVSHVSAEAMGRFVDMAKRSVESGRASFPKIGDPFLRMCAYSYFKPQAVNVGGKDNIFTDHPESSCAYPCVNDVVREFIRRLSFSDIGAYREKIGERLDNVIATSFIDFFEEVGKLHHDNEQLTAIRGRVRDAANYDDYRPVFDRYARSITRDAMSRFDMFLDIYRTNLETQMRVCGIEDREVLAAQVEGVKHLADGKLSPPIVQPGSHAARLQAHDECFTGENLGVFARG